MSYYTELYVAESGNELPKDAEKLDSLFEKISKGEKLPPRGQQAVNLGFTAHTLNDAKENPAIYNYYQWILNHEFQDKKINELTSKIIGMSFVSANIFQTNLPQPVTINPWQIDGIFEIPLSTKKAVIVENNGVFIWLHELHPDWPLINQSGNDFNDGYKKILKYLESKNLKITYLGDLDSEGIQIADRVSKLLKQDIFSIQTPNRVFDWLVRFGKNNDSRTKIFSVQNEILKEEMQSIHILHKFVEQEQLIKEYDKLIEQWLNTENL